MPRCPEPDRRPIGDLLTAATVALTVDPDAGDSAAEMAAEMAALWRGFCVAGAAGELLGICADPDTYPALWRNAQPVLAAARRCPRCGPARRCRAVAGSWSGRSWAAPAATS
jgi:hypothetical protein